MKNKKTVRIIAGVVIAGLVGTNAYIYTQWNTAKDYVTAEKQTLQIQQDAMDVFVSQTMNKSARYASHEDITQAFNIYSASNRIHYNGDDYYADLKDVTAHSFDEKRKVEYKAEVKMTFLKDKMENDMSYLHSKLPVVLMEKAIKIAKGLNVKTIEAGENEVNSHNVGVDSTNGHEGESAKAHAEHIEGNQSHDGHDHTVHIPYVDTMAMEKEAKKRFEVHAWKQTLDFNMDGQSVIELTAEMKEEILKQFVRGVVMKEEGIDLKNSTIKIESLKALDKITVSTKDKTLTYSYNKDTKELR